MAVIDSGSNSAGKANVDSAYNLNVALPNVPAQMGGIRLFSEVDSGAVTGTALLRSPEVSQDYRTRIGVDTVLFYDTFNATAQNTALWKHAFTTMTMTQSAGFLNINAAGTSTVANNSAYLQSWRYFPLIGTAPLSVEFTGQINQLPQANEVFMAGLGIAVAAAQPVDGAWFQLTTAGLEGVLRYNSGAAATIMLMGVADMPLNTNGKYAMIVGERQIEFWVDDVLLGTIDTPNAQGQPFITTALPLLIQKYNSGTVGSSPSQIIKVGDITVTLMDIASNKPWAHQMAGAGLTIHQGQDGGTMGTTALYPNATAATTVTGAALSQTTALATGLGGQAGITATVPGVDGWVTAYQVPAGGVNQTPRMLMVTGVKISAINIGAAVATTPTSLSWSLAFGGTQLNSLATAETGSFVTNTAKAARRVPLGLQSWTVGALIGAQANDVVVKFDSPIPVNPGEYVGAVAKVIQGTVTASQVIWAVVTFDGYFE
jgi:hypothetical protein